MNDKTKDLVYKSLYHAFMIKPKDKNKVASALDLIFSNDDIKNFIAQGTTKFVYKYKDGFVFKVVLSTLDSLQRFIKEPLFMLQGMYTNKPQNIIIYADKPRIVNECPHVNIYDIDIGDAAIITWYEEEARVTGLKNFPIDARSHGVEFIEETTPILEALGFTDLGNTNVGFFKTFPHIRWIDVQPLEDTKADCLRIL